MSKRQFIMLLGALIIILPFLGFPSSWDTAIMVLIGVLIIILAYNIKPLIIDNSKNDIKRVYSEGKLETNLPFVDHRNLSETDTANK